MVIGLKTTDRVPLLVSTKDYKSYDYISVVGDKLKQKDHSNCKTQRKGDLTQTSFTYFRSLRWDLPEVQSVHPDWLTQGIRTPYPDLWTVHQTPTPDYHLHQILSTLSTASFSASSLSPVHFRGPRHTRRNHRPLYPHPPVVTTEGRGRRGLLSPRVGVSGRTVGARFQGRGTTGRPTKSRRVG